MKIDGQFRLVALLFAGASLRVEVKNPFDGENVISLCLQRLLDLGIYKLVFTVIDTPDLLKISGASADLVRLLEAECYTTLQEFESVERCLENEKVGSGFKDVRYMIFHSRP